MTGTDHRLAHVLPFLAVGEHTQRGTLLSVLLQDRCCAPPDILGHVRPGLAESGNQMLAQYFRQPERCSAVVADHYAELFQLVKYQCAIPSAEDPVTTGRCEQLQEAGVAKQPFHALGDACQEMAGQVVLGIA